MTIRRSYVMTMGTNLGIQGLSIATGIITARALGPTGRGDLAVILLWPSLLSAVLCLCLHESIAYLIAQNREKASTYRYTGVLLTLALGLLAVLAGYFALPHLLDSSQQHLLSLSRWYLLSIPLGYIGGLLYTSFTGELNFRLYNFLRSLHPLVYCIGILFILATTKLTLTGAVVVNLMGHGMTLVVALLIAQKKGTFNAEANPAAFKMALRTGLTFHVLVITGVVVGRLDQIVIARNLSLEAIGLYAVALSIAGSQGSVTSAFSQIVTQVVASSKNAKEGLEILIKQFRVGWTVSAGVAIGIIILAPLAVPILYGPRFNAAIILSLILTPALLAQSLSGLLIYGLRGLKRPLVGPIVMMSQGAIFILFSLLLIQRWGATGVAFSLATANWITLLVLSGWIAKKFNLPLKGFWKLDTELIAKVWQLFQKRYVQLRRPKIKVVDRDAEIQA